MRALLYSAGGEMFASPLASLEESVDCPVVRQMPGADEHAVGVIDVRGRRIAAYSPICALNVSLEGGAGAALVIGSGAAGAAPIALLVSDVEDVVQIDAAAIRAAPGSEDADGILLGVFRHDGRLVSLVDPRAIHEACLAAGARR